MTTESSTTKPSADTGSGATATTDEDRTGRQYLPYAVMAVAFLLVPLFVGALVDGANATTAMLILLPVMALALGLLDGFVFRFTWVFPIMLGIFFWLATKIYFNDAAWIYIIGLVPLCGLGGWIGARLGGNDRPGFKASKSDEIADHFASIPVVGR